MTTTPPKTTRAWSYTTASHGLENDIQLSTTPLRTSPTRHLIKTIAVALNPVDHKPAESPLFSSLLIRKPATPGVDIVGRIVTPAAGSALKPGQLVFGAADKVPFAAGGLAEYVSAPTDGIVPVPAGVAPEHAVTIPVAGLTAYQSIVPRVKQGSRVFINGGSGGTGVFGIQIAKAVGCYVATTCSTGNVELCKSLGADVVLDYRTQDVVSELEKLGNFDLVIDNVGADRSVFWKAYRYAKPGAPFVYIAHAPTFADAWFTFKASTWPGWLGGAKRKFTGFMAKADNEELAKIAAWMAKGTVKPVVDSRFGFEDVPDAFRRLKTHRARGKVVVDVAPDTHQE